MEVETPTTADAAPNGAHQVEQNPDVRFLGRLLGNVIRTIGGEAIYRRTEYIRSASVDRHRGVVGDQAIDPGLEVLTLDDTLAFVRGFMLFSMLANLAEDRQGVAAEGGATVDDAIVELGRRGIDTDAIAALLEQALVAPVLTAHPTEVRRKSMIDHRNRIAELMRLRDSGAALTPRGDPIEQTIERQIALLWETRALRRERLYVADEVETAIAYMRDVFVPTLPALYARWDRALRRRAASFLRLGTWIGGDRDGNPYVDAASLERALDRSCDTILTYYLDQVHALGAELSISSGVSRRNEQLEALANISGDTGNARQDEPYRRAITGIYARLAATYRALTGRDAPRRAMVSAEPYRDAQAFGADLAVIADALASEGHGLLSGGAVDRLLRATEVFGFHLATLDLRQNADVHERVVAELLARAGVHADYLSLPEEERSAILLQQLGDPRLLTVPHGDYSDETKSELAIVHAAAAAQARYGPAAITTYLISKAESISDLLEVNILLKEAGLWRTGSPPRSSIMAVPLFETIGDLEQAPKVMRAWLAIPEVAATALARGYQEVMVGYSDSNKDGGYFTSVWSLHQASKLLAETFAQASLPMQLFHGRGGAVGRGGGSSFAAIRAQPAGTVQGRIRITEQGEVIAAKYGTIESATTNLEAMASATLLASLKPRPLNNRERFSSAMSAISAAAFADYRALVYETDGFRTFFRQMTPITEIAGLKIGSRPASRTKSDRIEDLRAIPWVFSWAQARVMLPGWYGAGAGLAACSDLPLLQEMYAEWPFFRTALDNLEMVLAKSDMAIAERYAALVEDRAAANQMFGRIRDGWNETRDCLLSISGQSRLLEHNSGLDASIRLRLPYIEPLNLLQIELIKRHRAGETDARISEGIQLSINAIATALRNSG